MAKKYYSERMVKEKVKKAQQELWERVRGFIPNTMVTKIRKEFGLD